MNVYSIDVKIAATAYIKANSEAEALAIANDRLAGCFLEMEGADVCGLRYTDPDLPEVSLSPAMTCHGLWEGAPVDLAEENVPDGDAPTD